MSANIVLASSSKYRAASLQRLNLAFEQRASDVDETPQPQETAQQLAARLAADKALNLVSAYPNSIIIGCDQTGLCNDQLMHKPGSRTAAIEQLSKMSGCAATFYTAMTVIKTNQDGVASITHDLDTTDLKLRLLSVHEIEAYVDADMPLDCAGSFKIEALGITLFSEVKTVDPSALQGISLIQLTRRLKQLGIIFGSTQPKC
jgi:septum formation protein